MVDVRELLATAVKVPGVSREEASLPEDLFPFPSLSAEQREGLSLFLRSKFSSRLLEPTASHLEHVVASARWQVVETILTAMKGA